MFNRMLDFDFAVMLEKFQTGDDLFRNALLLIVLDYIITSEEDLVKTQKHLGSNLGFLAYLYPYMATHIRYTTEVDGIWSGVVRN